MGETLLSKSNFQAPLRSFRTRLPYSQSEPSLKKFSWDRFRGGTLHNLRTKFRLFGASATGTNSYAPMSTMAVGPFVSIYDSRVSGNVGMRQTNSGIISYIDNGRACKQTIIRLRWADKSRVCGDVALGAGIGRTTPVKAGSTGGRGIVELQNRRSSTVRSIAMKNGLTGAPIIRLLKN
jgi:hypothetical protein